MTQGVTLSTKFCPFPCWTSRDFYWHNPQVLHGIMDWFSACYVSYFSYQLVAHYYWHSLGVSTGADSVHHLFYLFWWWDGCTFSKSMNCGQLSIRWSVQLLYRDLNKLETWADRSRTKFIKGKCRVLCLRCNNPKQQDRLHAKSLDSSCAEMGGWSSWSTSRTWVRSALDKEGQPHTKQC